MKTLLINGCSFGLGWKASDGFVQKLGCDSVINISKVATSFQRTCRSTIEWIAQNGLPKFVIVPITFSHRWEIAIGNDQDELDGIWFPMQRKEYVFSTGQKIRDDVSKDKLGELADLYYGCNPTSITYTGKLFTEIIMLSAFLESKNIDYLFFDMCNEFQREHIAQHKGFDRLKFLEDNKKIIDLFAFCGNRYMHDTMHNKEKVHFNTHHGPEQYQELEKYLLKYLEKL